MDYASQDKTLEQEGQKYTSLPDNPKQSTGVHNNLEITDSLAHTNQPVAKTTPEIEKEIAKNSNAKITHYLKRS